MVEAMIIAVYVSDARQALRLPTDQQADPGTTTVTALLMCYGLGALI
jgi:hypothetical protein